MLKKRKYVLSIDKLIINFNYNIKTETNFNEGFYDFERLKQILFKVFNHKIIFTPPKKPDNDYHALYELEFNNIKFGLLKVQHKQNREHLHKIVIYNNIYYQYQAELMEFLYYFTAYFTDYTAIFELALDTNVNVSKRLFKLMLKEDLILKSKYITCDFRKIYENNKFIFNEFETLYIDKRKNKTNYVQIRSENKTKEINNSSKKHYISEFHKNNGLNTNKNIYRLEVILANPQASVISENYYLYNCLTDETISKTTFKNNKKKYKKEAGLFKDIRRVKKLQLDLNRIYDQDYLTALFQCNLSRVVENPGSIIKLNRTSAELDFIETENEVKHNQKEIEISDHDKLEYEYREYKRNTPQHILDKIKRDTELEIKALDKQNRLEIMTNIFEDF